MVRMVRTRAKTRTRTDIRGTTARTETRGDMQEQDNDNGKTLQTKHMEN